ncbi:hypothetical protein [uncultured Propionivibrio sp.]|uniref:hypothetical protein n=1 Tax=uncultured Propionivibrio sp. TaxID=426737 RepID=UPI0029C08E4B|nr:hypothetical protein [uncultured Propionivibrio sp.]
MHTMEGFLPVEHAIGRSAASLPFLAWGLASIKKHMHSLQVALGAGFIGYFLGDAAMRERLRRERSPSDTTS